MPLSPGEKLLLASRPVTAKFATVHCCDCVPLSLCVFLFCMCAMENTWKAVEGNLVRGWSDFGSCGESGGDICQ